jgi:hypothetical protein
MAYILESRPQTVNKLANVRQIPAGHCTQSVPSSNLIRSGWRIDEWLAGSIFRRQSVSRFGRDVNVLEAPDDATDNRHMKVGFARKP